MPEFTRQLPASEMAVYADIIIASDFRFPGGTSSAIANEVRALAEAGYGVALLQVDSVIFRGKGHPWNDQIMEVIEAGQAFVPAVPMDLNASALFLHNPLVFQDFRGFGGRLSCERVMMVAHQAPADSLGRLYYDPWDIDRRVTSVLERECVWAPISPLCRERFEALGIELPQLEEDWSNLIFVDDWGVARDHARIGPYRIGRHSRSGPDKWPGTRKAILKAYPDRGDVQVDLLGIGTEVERLVGKVPSNWRCWRFGDVAVAEFLAGIDFFVYYHREDLVEAFGRTIAEAASAGCVCVLPPHFRPTFGDAAIYCEIEEAIPTVEQLAACQEDFRRQSRLGRERMDAWFGPDAYRDRVDRFLSGAACISTAAEGEGERVRRQGFRQGMLRLRYHAVQAVVRRKREVQAAVRAVGVPALGRH